MGDHLSSYHRELPCLLPSPFSLSFVALKCNGDSTCCFAFVIDCDCMFSDSCVHSIEERVMDAVLEHNKLATSVDT